MTVLRLAAGVDADAFIARHPDGIPDPTQAATTWFTDAKPAELRQLESVISLLVGAVGLAYLVAAVVISHGVWSQARSSRRQLAVMQAIGLTRRQMAGVTSWQGVPLVLLAVGLGAPLGLFAGRWAFAQFARSFDVVDTPSTPILAVGAFVVAALAAGLVGFLAARQVARRVRASVLLRQQ